MPIYEYACRSCGHNLEALQKISDAPLSECPACGRAELQKLVSAAGFVLKGGGWYVTDFRDKGKKSGGSTDAASTDSKSADSAAAPACGAGACPSCD
jgi:putative FmdB family regulatory protein